MNEDDNAATGESSSSAEDKPDLSEKTSRRRPRDDTGESSSSSSESLFHEAACSMDTKDSNEEGVKRRCHRSNSPPSTESYASCEGDNPANNSGDVNEEQVLSPEDQESLGDNGDEEGEEEEEEMLEDEDSDDDDVDEIPIQIRPRPKVNAKTQEEGSIVLQKPESKPRYNFMQDYLQFSQSTMRPSEFKRRRMGDMGLVQRLQQAHMLEGHEGCVNAIHFNESGSLLASGSDDRQIIVWDWLRGKKLFSFDSGHKSNVFQSKFLPLAGDTHIVTTSRDGQVRLAELSATGSCRSTRRLAQHKGASHKLALLNSRPHEFISGGEDGLIMALDVRQQEPIKLLTQKENNMLVRIYSVHANPADDNYLISAGNDQFVRLYDRRAMSQSDPQPLRKLCPHHLESDKKLHITCSVFSNDGQDIIGSYSDEDIFMFKTNDTGEHPNYVKRYQGHRNSHTVKGVNFFGPDSQFVVSGSDCGHIFFWDKEGEDIVHMMEGDVEGVVNCLEPHPNLPFMATSGLDNEVKIWMPTSETKIDKSVIKKTVMDNADPSKNASTSSALMDGQMLWQLFRHMQTLERRRRRARRQAAGEENENTSEDDEDEDDDDDVEDEDGAPGCAQS